MEDEIYIVNVYLTKSGNLKVLIRIQANQSNVITEGGAEAEASRHEGKGCGENFSSSLGQFAKIKVAHFTWQVKASLARPQHRADAHRHQGIH